MPSHGIRTVYQPFSLQERMAPLNMMKEEYDKMNEGLVDLEMTASQAAQYIDPNSDAGRAIAAYNKSLEDAATTLSSEGLKGLSRTTLYNLKRTYQRDIAPINEGAKNYAALQAQIKQMQWKDPTIMVNDMPTLDEYIKNPSALPNLVSGAQLQQEGATAALQLQGVDYDAIQRYMAGDTSAIPNMDATIEQIAKTYGVSSDQALGYISRGVLAGLGKRATDFETAKQQAEMKFDYQMRLEKYQQQQQNYRAGLTATAQKRDDDLRALMSGYVWNPNTKNYEFSEEAFQNAARSYGGTHRTSTATTPKAPTETYNPLKGTHFVDKAGNNPDSPSSKTAQTHNIVDTEYLKNLSPEQIAGIFRTLNIHFDSEEYMNGAGDAIDWSRVIDDYRGYLDKYEFKAHQRTATRSAAKANDNYTVIEINPRAANSKVTSPTSSADRAADRAGVDRPSASTQTEEDEGANAY
jgi:hypothetical protein